MTVLDVQNVTYWYPNSVAPALDGVSVSVETGQFAAVMGGSGSGKTTFLRLINGVIPRSFTGRMEGRVDIFGYDTRTLSVAWLAQRVGMVLEDPDVQLFTDDVYSEVAFGPENLGWEPGEIIEVVEWALGVVGLKVLKDRRPSELSGGQKQRLTIAAALATRPEILVLDEPTSQIDSAGSGSIFEVISRLQRENRMTVIVATNDAERVAERADKVFVLNDGVLAGQGRPEDVFSDAALAYLVGCPQTLRLADELVARGLPFAERPAKFKDCAAALSRMLGRGN